MWSPRIILANSLSLRGLIGTLRRIARAVRESAMPCGREAIVVVSSLLPTLEPGREERGEGVCWRGLITDVSSLGEHRDA
jgi:hypothetical protein